MVPLVSSAMASDTNKYLAFLERKLKTDVLVAQQKSLSFNGASRYDVPGDVNPGKQRRLII